MDEFTGKVLSLCISVLLIELLSQLFPKGAETFVRASAILLICITLLIEFFKLDIDLSEISASNYDVYSSEMDLQQNTVSYGIELLRQRLYTLLNTADISVSGNESGISIHYRLNENDGLEIARVRVCLRYSSDSDRARSILQSVLTQTIPVEVYTE